MRDEKFIDAKYLRDVTRQNSTVLTMLDLILDGAENVAFNLNNSYNDTFDKNVCDVNEMNVVESILRERGFSVQINKSKYTENNEWYWDINISW